MTLKRGEELYSTFVVHLTSDFGLGHLVGHCNLARLGWLLGHASRSTPLRSGCIYFARLLCLRLSSRKSQGTTSVAAESLF